MSAGYEVLKNVQTYMVRGGSTARYLGAFGTNYWRSYVYPLYSPAGQTVVREFPFDHPFHTGVFVAQNPVKVGGREGNFWGLPIKRTPDDHLMLRIGRMDPQGEPAAEVLDDGVRFVLRSVWRDEHEEPLIDEQRTVTLRALPDATVCDMVSRKTAAYGAAEFSRTKFGSIGMRVEPRLLPPLGGRIIGCLDGQLQRGSADEVANARACDAVAYEADVPGIGIFGVCMMIIENSASENRRGPWFIRDYGQAMFNAVQDESIHISEGARWTIALRVVAYDGPLTAERLGAWR
jgi:hypothetical protein